LPGNWRSLFPIQIDRTTSELANTTSLLANTDFQQPLGTLPGWSACVDANALRRSANSTTMGASALSRDPWSDGYFVEVGPGECILQTFAVIPDREYSLSCAVASADTNQWAGMAISFYDEAGNFISESDAAQADPYTYSDSYFRYTGVSAITPAEASVGLAWFYAEGGGRITDCELQLSATDGLDTASQQYSKTANVERHILYNDGG